MFILLLILLVPILLILAMLGWVMILALIIGGVVLAVTVLLLPPLLFQNALPQNVSSRTLLMVGALILAGELFLIWNLATKPVDIGLPAREAVASVHIQDIENYDSSWERLSREITCPKEYTDALLEEIYTTEYKRDLRIKWPWQASLKQEFDQIYKVELMDTDGTVLKTIHIYDQLTLRPLNEKGKERKLRTSEEQPFDTGIIRDVFKAEERADTAARWQGFIDEFTASLTYIDDPGDFSFTIPETRPEGRFYLYLKAKGMIVYDPEGAYEPIELVAFPNEQEEQSWVPGTEYTISFNDGIFEYIYMEMQIDGFTFTIDLLEYLDDRYAYR